MMKYITRIGQKTGISKIVKKDVNKDKIVALTALSQNLNSGRRRIKGLNSSSTSSVPSSKLDENSSCSRDGSNFGVRKAKNKLRR